MEIEKFAPLFDKPNLSDQERYSIEPFFTNIDQSVFAVTFIPPEVIGALCARTSRAKDDLRAIFLNEFIKPFLEEKSEYGESLRALIDFLHQHPLEVVFSNPKGREFYIKWLSQFGDDSIAQMAGTHLIYAGISQLAIKHLEDMRLGIAPIEKSTRFVDYSAKVNGQYLYYADPTLEGMGLMKEYREVMDNLFDNYTLVNNKYFEHLKQKYPGEKELVLKTKAFDVARKLLPVSTLSSVSFFGNGQAFEYAITRSLDNKLGEIRWMGQRALDELNKIMPAFLRRIESQDSEDYRKYISERSDRVNKVLTEVNWPKETIPSQTNVKLLDYDGDAENKIIAGLIYLEAQEPFSRVLGRVRRLSAEDKEKILQEVLKDRKQRYYKIPRAFENAYLRFEITMNIGAWRDLHRHRIHTQYRQRFSPYNGFDTPPELKEIGLENEFKSAIEKTEELYEKVRNKDQDIAQYCCALAHKLRFIQYQNLRSFFWEAELRTIPQGHPDYRKIEHDKIKLIQKIYPLISKYLLVDMQEYDFARRGTVEQIQKKEGELKQYFSRKDAKIN
ncbi:FAD-dependent thymidylate synthase [Patescibacteria group bacterium]|nr:FAD-dependent thymidylate synthase [Patescibacteria group bacterium]MBU4367735.1 FAD-dependent thymidylate synthase [Patescibacteria group bacterium]MBU4461815.1 FAD-dependent thymidylate synthase [Patescibacteria group bacterium]MCG2700054.1 FAD-dependent thymidylate synthase [Candidatus Parcubacteria bacterium]